MTQKEKDLKTALALAGQVALKAREVVDSNALNLSENIKELMTALNNYDNKIMDISFKDEPQKGMKVGDIVTIHELAHQHFDAEFKTVNGSVVYEAIDYPNNASGRWAYVSRMTPNGIETEKIHTDTKVEILSIRK